MSVSPCPKCNGDIKIFIRTGVGAVAVCQKCNAEYTICGVNELHIYNGCKIRKSTTQKVERLWNAMNAYRNPAVLASITSDWVNEIINGRKLYEVRKIAPSLRLPFTVYIYCTKAGRLLFVNDKGEIISSLFAKDELLARKPDATILNGMVVGEFVCDEIVEIPRKAFSNGYTRSEQEEKVILQSQVHENFLRAYCGEKPSLFFWHISKLKVYDKPKEISDFNMPDYKHECFGSWVWKQGHWLTRAPQSYQFVETLKKGK